MFNFYIVDPQPTHEERIGKKGKEILKYTCQRLTVAPVSVTFMVTNFFFLVTPREV